MQHWFDPIAIGIVFLGTLAATVLRCGLVDARLAFATVRGLVQPAFDPVQARAEVAKQITEIATRLNVSEEEVISMNRRLSGDASLNAPIRATEGESGEWQDWLVDDSQSQEDMLVEQDELDNRRGLLKSALMVLNDREKRIFEARRLSEDPLTLEELSGEFDISRERVRQIEVRAFEKVQDAVKAEAKRQAQALRPIESADAHA